MAQYKLQIAMPPAVAARMDEYCKRNQLTRSGFITMAVDNYLTAHAMVDALRELTLTVKHMAATGGTEDEHKQLDHILELIEIMKSGEC